MRNLSLSLLTISCLLLASVDAEAGPNRRARRGQGGGGTPPRAAAATPGPSGPATPARSWFCSPTAIVLGAALALGVVGSGVWYFWPRAKPSDAVGSKPAQVVPEENEQALREAFVRAEQDFWIRGQAGRPLRIAPDSPLRNLPSPLTITFVPDIHDDEDSIAYRQKLVRPDRLTLHEADIYSETQPLNRGSAGISPEKLTALIATLEAQQSYWEFRQKLNALIEQQKSGNLDLSREQKYALTLLVQLRQSPAVVRIYRTIVEPAMRKSDIPSAADHAKLWNAMLSDKELPKGTTIAETLANANPSIAILGRLSAELAKEVRAEGMLFPELHVRVNRLTSECLFPGDFGPEFADLDRTLNFDLRERILFYNTLQTIERAARAARDGQPADVQISLGLFHALRGRNLLRATFAEAGITNIRLRVDNAVLGFRGVRAEFDAERGRAIHEPIEAELRRWAEERP